MLKKTLIATATAGLISVGALVGTAGTASAASITFGGPGWHVGIGNGPNWGGPRPRQVCQPVFKTVRWWDRWGRPHFKRVVVRQECHWVGGPHHGGPKHGPNPGWPQYPRPHR
jgi:hypothetical protein